MTNDQDFARRLKNFDEVWRRVAAAKSAAEAAQARDLRLMPRRGRKNCCPRSRRP